MARVEDNEEVTAVIATGLDGEEGTLQYEKKNPTLHDMLPGFRDMPSVTKIVDVDGNRKDGAKSLVERFHLGFTSSTSHYSTVPVTDSAADLCAAFKEAGFSVPPVEVPMTLRIARAIAPVRERFFG